MSTDKGKTSFAQDSIGGAVGQLKNSVGGAANSLNKSLGGAVAALKPQTQASKPAQSTNNPPPAKDAKK